MKNMAIGTGAVVLGRDLNDHTVYNLLLYNWIFSEQTKHMVMCKEASTQIVKFMSLGFVYMYVVLARRSSGYMVNMYYF